MTAFICRNKVVQFFAVNKIKCCYFQAAIGQYSVSYISNQTAGPLNPFDIGMHHTEHFLQRNFIFVVKVTVNDVWMVASDMGRLILLPVIFSRMLWHLVFEGISSPTLPSRNYVCIAFICSGKYNTQEIKLLLDFFSYRWTLAWMTTKFC